ncbi:Protein of unknown function [Roseovarius nanhaiticus]|uniref:Membrane-anchored ribosome-binding protein, inhibits growth in stationary phase, ElaB/YqjD/DUF883 family n=1 Tax=Roseovarius nanhaiticus TaxID=573024 RepID=A0A1N7HMY8_9RHOB|nr:DUF3618 domain-containing protein [Roseovarius nanhaiticus]SEL36962.1 Protein of unknown function [Roseovarius nanhaiticus]SIS26209.1 Protein of unknown function [Roseovarius nanhaiticus]
MTNDSRTPEEIEREIERERDGLKDSIEGLQDRFSLDGVFQQLGDQFREHGGEFGRSVARSARENPVALAVTGAGLAWLMFGGNRSSDRRDDRDRDRDYRTRDARPPATFVRDREWDTDHGHARHFDDSAPDRAARRGAGYAGPKTVTGGRHPSAPSWARDWDEGERRGTASGHSSDGLGAKARSAAEDARDKVASGSSSAAGAVSSAADSVRDSAGNAAETVSDSASSAAQRVRDSAGNVWSSASDHANAVQRRLTEGTENLSQEARERIAAARARALDARDEAGRRLNRGADQAADFYDDHPLVVGAVAFAVGAAIAGALPRTRTEDEYIGGYSDDLYEEAERIYAEEVEKAQKVVQAGVDEAKTVASDLEGDVKDAAATAADKAKSAANKVADAATEKAKHENLGDIKDDAKRES